MSKRDLQDDKKWIEHILTKVSPNDVDQIAIHAIDRAISAEKELERMRHIAGLLASRLPIEDEIFDYLSCEDDYEFFSDKAKNK